MVVAPQGAGDRDGDREYLDWDASKDENTAISHDLPALHRQALPDDTPAAPAEALVGLSATSSAPSTSAWDALSQIGAVEIVERLLRTERLPQ